MATNDWRSMFDREYIGAWDLPKGVNVTCTIATVKAGELTAPGGRKSRKPVVYFEGKDKGLALNKTNAKAIAGMYGNDTSKWIGRPIAIYATVTQFGGEEVECIRVRPTIPQQKRSNGRGQPQQDPQQEQSQTEEVGDGSP